ncbi:E3 ubiquitin-protein ligase TRIM39-like isoform X1 [Rhinatrema bivittatum]|uniref:E3 ubiquitin-protein ligase TRIM39-like isoform X1 n=1 Tax=Rhinatrema bivittatum TaxID=194408 RepID=UPI00112723EF|nr:E3 ubiquitin-protein ligase TRIM39-like isoform X1 [Rhinatrema bivittatum]XP_029461564.1 E3 ubiquitin-protein ligase TRIM39-like isoform X1 [Rhinatrema bivittatum]
MKLLFPVRSMAAVSPAKRLRDEASCSVCLDYFTDPVTLDCGHNFCHSCITLSWKGLDTNFPCPQCRKSSQQRSFRPNRQLARLIEIAKKLCQNPAQLKEKNLCEGHEEKLKLFCVEDQKPICVVCNKSQDHRSHTVIPREEAVQEYKKKFQTCLDCLRKQLGDLLKLKSSEEKKAEDLRSETEIERQKIVTDIEELHQFLNEQKQILLLTLEEEKEKILQRIGENVTQLENQISSIKQLISEIEEKSQQSAAEILKDVKDAMSRYQNVEFPEPKVVSTDLKMDFLLGYPQQLKTLFTKFAGWWMEYGKYAVDLTLDPETAHPLLILSEDRKSVRRGGQRQDVLHSPQRFDNYLYVLGCESFTSGRHYWEVQERNDTAWCFGVCKDSVTRKGKFSLSPEEGYWAVMYSGKQEFCALTSPVTPLSLSDNYQAMGIFLDYEAGKVSVFNADGKSHLFTFTETFSGKLRPFFCPGHHSGMMRIRTFKNWD